MTYEVNDATTVNAAIYNVGDASITDSDNNTYQSGRTVWLGVTAKF